MNEVFDFLKACKTFYLATSDDGQPRVRPFGALDIFEGKLGFQTGKVKEVSRQLHENPNVEICAFNGKEWIRVWGRVFEDERREAKAHMLDANPSLRRMYSEDDGNTEVWFFEPGSKATISSFTAKPIEIDF